MGVCQYNDRDEVKSERFESVIGECSCSKIVFGSDPKYLRFGQTETESNFGSVCLVEV